MSLRDVPTSHSVIFSLFGCTNSSLVEFRSGHLQFSKLNIKQDNIKKLYEEVFKYKFIIGVHFNSK